MRLLGVAGIATMIATSCTFADDLRGRTLLFDYAGGNGKIFINRSNSVFYSYEATGVGIEFKIGKTISPKYLGCNFLTTASQVGNTISLNWTAHCVSGTSVNGRIIATVDGETCTVQVRGNQADACRLIVGNQL